MEQPTQTPLQPASVLPAPATPAPPVQTPPSPQPIQAPPRPPVAPPQKKSHAWIWLLGGCFTIIALTLITVVALGWWGARKVKKELENYQPNIEGIKKSIDQMNEEGKDWENKSKEFRDSLPNPEDLSKELQNQK